VRRSVSHIAPGPSRWATRRHAVAAFAVLLSVPLWVDALVHPPEPLVAGLEQPTDGECAGGWRLEDGTCTHGSHSEQAPRTAPASTAEMQRLAAASREFTCDGDGTSGRRVEVLYAHAPDRPNRYRDVVGGIRAIVADVQFEFADSAEVHGSLAPLMPRFVHSRPQGGDCRPVVADVTLPSAGDDDSFAATIQALTGMGYDDPSRRYLVMMDSSAGCGVGQYWDDDTADPTANRNNRVLQPLFSRIDAPCWDWAETHELVHNLGGVQDSAPNATGFGHCNDEYDLLCYDDGGPSVALRVTSACGSRDPWDRRLDCNGDDYFNPNPRPGSYLDLHWNVADSAWLFTPATIQPAVVVAPVVRVTAATLDPQGLLAVAGTLDQPGEAVTSVEVARGDGTLLGAATPAPSGAWSLEVPVASPPAQVHVTAVDGVGTRSQTVVAPVEQAETVVVSGRFLDDDDSPFEVEIERLAELGITAGCNPPTNDRYCPSTQVTRGQLAAFLVRALELPAGTRSFQDTVGGLFEDDVAALAEAGVTAGCNPPANDRFCPGDVVTRGQMAAFVVRALELPAGSTGFVDTAGGIFADAASALAAADITRGCNPPANDRYCPSQVVTRGQMAAFLVRALDG